MKSEVNFPQHTVVIGQQKTPTFRRGQNHFENPLSTYWTLKSIKLVNTAFYFRWVNYVMSV